MVRNYSHRQVARTVATRGGRQLEWLLRRRQEMLLAILEILPSSGMYCCTVLSQIPLPFVDRAVDPPAPRHGDRRGFEFLVISATRLRLQKVPNQKNSDAQFGAGRKPDRRRGQRRGQVREEGKKV